MLASSLVGDDYELHLVALLKGLAALDLTGVEEQLLALVDLVAQKSVLP